MNKELERRVAAWKAQWWMIVADGGTPEWRVKGEAPELWMAFAPTFRHADADYEIRRRPDKPRRMVLQKTSYPAPLKEAPENDNKYWLADNSGIYHYSWSNADVELRWLKRGQLFHTRADAEEYLACITSGSG